MRHAQMMPMDCSIVLHIEALTMSSEITPLKVITCAMDATQALFQLARLWWIQTGGSERIA